MGKLIKLLFGALVLLYLFLANLDVLVDAFIWIFLNPGTFMTDSCS